MDDVPKKLLKAARAGDRSAIIRVFRMNPAAFGNAEPFAAIAKAKSIVINAAARRSLSTDEQVEFDQAEQFLADLAEALAYVPPDVRSRAILSFCATMTNKLTVARPIIVATPRSERMRETTVKRLAAETRLDREVVKTFLDNPRTGAQGLARKLTGKKFAVTDEHVRKLEAKHRDWNIRGNLALIFSTKKSR